jgi:amino acid permease
VSIEVIVYVLTALAAVVVVLTRLRLGKQEGGAGRVNVGSGLLNVHTGAGVLALVVWIVYLVAPEDSAAGGELVGIVALALWWVVTLAGLLVLVRWVPSRGKHATTGVEDTWSEGPGLSILAHVGMLVGVLVFTYAYAGSLI